MLALEVEIGGDADSVAGVEVEHDVLDSAVVAEVEPRREVAVVVGPELLSLARQLLEDVHLDLYGRDGRDSVSSKERGGGGGEIRLGEIMERERNTYMHT